MKKLLNLLCVVPFFLFSAYLPKYSRPIGCSKEREVGLEYVAEVTYYSYKDHKEHTAIIDSLVIRGKKLHKHIKACINGVKVPIPFSEIDSLKRSKENRFVYLIYKNDGKVLESIKYYAFNILGSIYLETINEFVHFDSCEERVDILKIKFIKDRSDLEEKIN